MNNVVGSKDATLHHYTFPVSTNTQIESYTQDNTQLGVNHNNVVVVDETKKKELDAQM